MPMLSCQKQLLNIKYKVMPSKSKISVFNEKKYYLPFDDYIELCRKSLVTYLNHVDKYRFTSEEHDKIAELGLSATIIKNAVKKADALFYKKFIDKQNGFDKGRALNRLCQIIIKERKTKKTC